MPHRTIAVAGKETDQVGILLKALKQQLRHDLTEPPLPTAKTV